ncbi:phosphatidate cytidylyltransferase [Arthrobacter jiangjiafuii]|uniref:Phosphatidate cytidylyltransferase n=1 Tax=Arthrobacter jiangjiafuii TaxID=2817475 RepID=A0A975M7E3_9MICC|nr:phosphatidate cytidylyltransferase [Arthrobacter jiangjiafuii]MBP3044063.1 phosphatidate cytidylyltransferase [Arthrobacter jiangjiafuii]QWC11049.1 phosphatidate cytidylyltransferase [Arthrobacter jiangjiafuii]
MSATDGAGVSGTDGARRARKTPKPLRTPKPLKAPKAPAKVSKAGRNLPAAIVVGVILVAALLAALLFFPFGIVAIATVFAAVGVWEVSRALEVRGIKVPMVPVLVGTVALPFAAYFGGSESLAFALVATVVAILLWRTIDTAEDAVRSVLAGIFVVLWVPFLLSFAMLLLGEPGGQVRVAILLLLVVSNDTFGYLVGALFGKHPMAPKISPKKSWEGFAGSAAGATVVGIVAALFFLDQPWWFGLVLAVATVAAATAGDFSESMIKRELGVKDMSNLLPGHGGIMDRLDSIVFASPVVFLISALLIPGA